MKTFTRNGIQILAGLSVGLFFFYLFIKNVSLSQIIEGLAEAKLGFVALSALSTMIGFYFRALRWRYFLMPLKRIRIGPLFSTMSIGYMVSTWTPRLGELVRPYLLGAKENISKSSALATVVIERVFDLVSVMILFSVYLIFFASSNAQAGAPEGELTLRGLQKSGLLVAFAALAAVLFLLGLRFKRESVIGATRRLGRVLPARLADPLTGFTASFADGLAMFQSPRNIIMAIVYSAVTWFFVITAVWVMPFAYGLEPVAFTSVFFVVFMIAIGVSIPVPGAIGTFHFMCGAGFHMVGIQDPGVVKSMVIMLHFASVIPINIVGLIAFWKEGISLYVLKAAQAGPVEPAGPVLTEALEPTGECEPLAEKG